MIALEGEAERAPVWAAEETNAASMGLARKLGFTPVDEIFLWEVPPLLAALGA